MSAFSSFVTGLTLILGPQSNHSTAGTLARQEQPPAVEIQVIALDTAFRHWSSQGRLKGKTLVVDSRPALPSIGGNRRATREMVARTAARSTSTTIRMATSIGARPASPDELNPCSARACKFTPDLATIILGEPVVNGDTATVVVGVSIVYQARGGNLRPAAVYQLVTLFRTSSGWRPISMKLAGEG